MSKIREDSTEAPDGITTSYAYNDFDELIEVERVGTGVRTGDVFEYDALGRRDNNLLRSVGTFYVFDGSDRVLDIEVRGTNAPVLSHRYVHGAYVDQPVALETFVSGSAAPVGEFSYHADHLGSVRFLTDEAGEVVKEYD